MIDALSTAVFKVGAKVAKRTGDYVFFGIVVDVFVKRDGRSVRYVVENDDGLVLILNSKQLEPYA